METQKESIDHDFYEQYWQDDAHNLNHCLTHAARFRVPSLLNVYGDLKRPLRVLDYGCGNGALTYWLARCGFGDDIIGIDISEAAVKKATARFGRPGLRFEVFDPLQSLEYLGRFDVVVSSHVLEHIPHPEEAIAQMSVLSDTFLFEVPLEDCATMNARASLKGVSRTTLSDNHLHFWDKHSFEKFVRSTGLLVLRQNWYSSGAHAPSRARLLRSFQRGLLKVNGDLYSSVFGSNFTILAWKDPLPKT
jgi:SAM-dependent methyltransferase